MKTSAVLASLLVSTLAWAGVEETHLRSPTTVRLDGIRFAPCIQFDSRNGTCRRYYQFQQDVPLYDSTLQIFNGLQSEIDTLKAQVVELNHRVDCLQKKPNSVTNTVGLADPVSECP